MNPPIICFALIGQWNDREGFWYELVTVRKRGDQMATRFNIVSRELGRRLADKLCDRYGIEDRGGLYCGQVFWIRDGKGGAA